jgi:NAD(P)-dependent dehydrogenase (short-subunit alcohol dehydrogenase family)
MSGVAKTVLVTGGSRGIGAATAILCGAKGWRVVVNYRKDQDAAQAVVAAIKQQGGEAFACQADVADEADNVRLFDRAEQQFGPLDGVVVNAGVIGPRITLAQMDADRIKQIIDVNVIGALLTAREAARRMKTGSLVLVSSVAARLGSGGAYVDYAASKGAMDTLNLGLAHELAPHIRVNAVRPGLIETDIHTDSGWPECAHILGATTPLGRAGTAQEVGEAIVWLLSDSSSYVTGANIDVAGGR